MNHRRTTTLAACLLVFSAAFPCSANSQVFPLVPAGSDVRIDLDGTHLPDTGVYRFTQTTSITHINTIPVDLLPVALPISAGHFDLFADADRLLTAIPSDSDTNILEDVGGGPSAQIINLLGNFVTVTNSDSRISLPNTDTLRVEIDDLFIDTVNSSLVIGDFQFLVNSTAGTGSMSLLNIPTTQQLRSNPPVNASLNWTVNGTPHFTGNVTFTPDPVDTTVIDYSISNIVMSTELETIISPGLPINITSLDGKLTEVVDTTPCANDDNVVCANNLAPGTSSHSDSVTGNEVISFDPVTFDTILDPSADFIDFFRFTGLDPGSDHEAYLSTAVPTDSSNFVLAEVVDGVPLAPPYDEFSFSYPSVDYLQVTADDRGEATFALFYIWDINIDGDGVSFFSPTGPFDYTVDLTSLTPGDFDNDGDADNLDIDTLALSVGLSVPPADAKFDIDSDGDVDHADYQLYATTLLQYDDGMGNTGQGTLLADFNRDGLVDILDLDRLGRNWLSPGGWAAGDTNGDLFIDVLDLDKLGQNWNQTVIPAVPTPEPSSLVLLAMGALGCMRRRRAA